jgi:hypothetical protein
VGLQLFYYYLPLLLINISHYYIDPLFGEKYCSTFTNS